MSTSNPRREPGGGHLIRSAVLQVVEKQIAENDPPEARAALDRLLAQGYTRPAALQTLGFALSQEVWAVLRNERPYDPDRFRAALEGIGRGDPAPEPPEPGDVPGREDPPPSSTAS